VLLTEGAARDIEGIHRYISDTDRPEIAETVLDQLLDVVTLQMAHLRLLFVEDLTSHEPHLEA
jgi:plasmid stabilization system protein ParE